MIEKISEISRLSDFNKIFDNQSTCDGGLEFCNSCKTTSVRARACLESRRVFCKTLAEVDKRSYVAYEAARRLFWALDLYKEFRVDEIIYEEGCEGLEESVITVAEKKAFNDRQRRVVLELLELLSPEFVAQEREKMAAGSEIILDWLRIASDLDEKRQMAVLEMKLKSMGAVQ